MVNHKSAIAPLVVRQITATRDIHCFLRLPWFLYRDDPHWVPPLLAELRARLSRRHNPYFQHADAAMFLAQRDGVPVGRITAQICKLAQEHQTAGDGHFGFFECEDSQETADALFAAAAGWLSDRGMVRMIGPLNLSINEEAGLLVDGFHRPPFVFMGHHLPHYGAMFESAGMTKATDVYAYFLDITQPYTERIERLVRAAARDPKIKLRNVDKNRVDEELGLLLEVFNEAWSENWGYVPMTTAEVGDLAMMVKRLFTTDAVVLAEIDGEVAGFIVVIPNLNEITRDLDGRLFPWGWLRLFYRLKRQRCRSVRVPLMGIRNRYHGTRTGASIAIAMIDRCRSSSLAKGAQHCEMSWILESNTSMRNILEASGSTLDKTYRLYWRSLP